MIHRKFGLRCVAAPVAALAALVAVSTSAEAGCVQAGGEATMVTESLAQFMANAALKDSMKANG